MLVLSRRIGESIVIGEGEKQIIVTLTDIRGETARIGVIAPAEIPIHRLEIFEAIQREQVKVGGETKGDAA